MVRYEVFSVSVSYTHPIAGLVVVVVSGSYIHPIASPRWWDLPAERIHFKNWRRWFCRVIICFSKLWTGERPDDAAAGNGSAAVATVLLPDFNDTTAGKHARVDGSTWHTTSFHPSWGVNIDRHNDNCLPVVYKMLSGTISRCPKGVYAVRFSWFGPPLLMVRVPLQAMVFCAKLSNKHRIMAFKRHILENTTIYHSDQIFLENSFWDF